MNHEISCCIWAGPATYVVLPISIRTILTVPVVHAICQNQCTSDRKFSTSSLESILSINTQICPFRTITWSGSIDRLLKNNRTLCPDSTACIKLDNEPDNWVPLSECRYARRQQGSVYHRVSWVSVVSLSWTCSPTFQRDMCRFSSVEWIVNHQ